MSADTPTTRVDWLDQFIADNRTQSLQHTLLWHRFHEETIFRTLLADLDTTRPAGLR